MKARNELQIPLVILTLSICIMTACVSHKSMECVGMADFEFYPPSDFELISRAPEKAVLCFYGNKNGDSINVSYYGYLNGRELTQTVCDEMVEAFNRSELRSMIKATAAMSPKYAFIASVRTCYYYYEFIRPNGSSRVEYKVYQGTNSRSYAITAVYAGDAPQRELIQKALHSFKIK